MMLRGNHRCLLIIAGFLTTSLIAGCSPSGDAKLYPVTGQVAFNGETVPEGRITFKIGGASGNAYSAPITNGSYSLQSKPGSAIVEITASRIIPGKFDNSNGTPEPVGEMYIPAKYNSASKLTKEIEEKSNTISFELTK